MSASAAHDAELRGEAAAAASAVQRKGDETEPRRTTRRMAFVGILAAAAALGVAALATNRRAPPLPVYGDLGAFRLTSASGRPFGSDDLAGRVWIAGFVFTRCPTICPVTTAAMGRMQEALRASGAAGRVHLVSFSVDPTYDTPERLALYARAHGADAATWTFLTGELTEVTRTVSEGLKMAMAEMDAKTASGTDFAGVMHGTHFVLVDGARRIRGYYAQSDAGFVERIVADARRLGAAGAP